MRPTVANCCVQTEIDRGSRSPAEMSATHLEFSGHGEHPSWGGERRPPCALCDSAISVVIVMDSKKYAPGLRNPRAREVGTDDCRRSPRSLKVSQSEIQPLAESKPVDGGPGLGATESSATERGGRQKRQREEEDRSEKERE